MLLLHWSFLTSSWSPFLQPYTSISNLDRQKLKNVLLPILYLNINYLVNVNIYLWWLLINAWIKWWHGDMIYTIKCTFIIQICWVLITTPFVFKPEQIVLSLAFYYYFGVQHTKDNLWSRLYWLAQMYCLCFIIWMKGVISSYNIPFHYKKDDTNDQNQQNHPT